MAKSLDGSIAVCVAGHAKVCYSFQQQLCSCSNSFCKTTARRLGKLVSSSGVSMKYLNHQTLHKMQQQAFRCGRLNLLREELIRTFSISLEKVICVISLTQRVKFFFYSNIPQRYKTNNHVNSFIGN